jgi:hypothetical protein
VGADVADRIQRCQPRPTNDICNAIATSKLLLDAWFATSVKGEEAAKRHQLTSDPNRQVIVVSAILATEIAQMRTGQLVKSTKPDEP